MTERLFREDPYLLTFDARVVDVQAADGQFIVFLDRTAFFAECGGQPCDTGVLAGIPVRDVQEDGELIRHTLDAPLKIGSVVKGVVDSDRRRDHRQQHHGQHLLSRALLDQSNARTVSFHLGGDACTIDLDRTLNSSAIEEAEQLVNETIWRALPVSSREVSRSEAGALGIRIPERAGDRIRIVDAEGFDVQACSGTHPRSTAEVGVVLILGQSLEEGIPLVHGNFPSHRIHPIRFFNSASTALRYSSVVKCGAVSLMSSARSFVILPLSTRSTQTFSTVSANFTTSGVSSILPR